jgi:hypothetical protein
MQIQHVLEGYGLDNDSKAYVIVWNGQSTSNIFFKAIRCIASGSLQPTFLNEIFLPLIQQILEVVLHVFDDYGLANDSKAYVLVWNGQSTSSIFFKAIHCIASGSLQPTFLNEFFYL